MKVVIFMLAAALFAVASGQRPHDCGDVSKPVLGGVDVVAFRKLNSKYDKPVFGSAANTATYGGYSFHFSSAANAKAFQGKPEYYAPAWGSSSSELLQNTFSH